MVRLPNQLGDSCFGTKGFGTKQFGDLVGRGRKPRGGADGTGAGRAPGARRARPGAFPERAPEGAVLGWCFGIARRGVWGFGPRAGGSATASSEPCEGSRGDRDDLPRDRGWA